MAKKIEVLEDVLKLDGTRYNREVSVGGNEWSTFNHKGCFAFSKIIGDVEVVTVMNIGDEEVVASVTVDKHLSPVGTKMKDIIGTPKHYAVEEAGGRHYVNLTVKPGYVATLKKTK